MGAVCAKPNEDISFDSTRKKTVSKSIANSIAFHGVEFYLEDQLISRKKEAVVGKADKIIRPDSCLLIFAETHAKLEDHMVLKKFGDNVGAKVQQFIEAKNLTESQERFIAKEQTEQRVEETDIKVMPIAIKDLPFSTICVVRVNVWSGTQEKLKIAEELTDKLRRTFQKLVGRKFKNILITEINDEFGIPSQICAKSLCQVLAVYHSQIEWTAVVCSCQDSLDMHEDFLTTAVAIQNKNGSFKTASGVVDKRASSIYF